jgi:hypothetical protein
MQPESATALRETCAELRAAQRRWEAAAALVVPTAARSHSICDRYAEARSRWPLEAKPTNEQLASLLARLDAAREAIRSAARLCEDAAARAPLDG